MSLSMRIKTIKDIDVRGKRVLVRVDLNVPFDENGNITDDSRIIGALPTILYLVRNNAKTILISHIGRPNGAYDRKASMALVVGRVSRSIGKKVLLAKDVIGPDAKAAVTEMKDGDIVLLENARFHKEDTLNDPEFSAKLAGLAEVFVNDAFATSHRSNASNVGVSKYLPTVSGFLIQREIDTLTGVLNDPQRPFTAILGGSKVSDKIGLIENLLDKVNTLLIGGGMAFTFLKAKGHNIGKSICEIDKIGVASMIIEKAKQKNVELLLPTGFLVADRCAAGAEFKTVGIDSIEDDLMGLDIDQGTIQRFISVIERSGTIVWNGPMGVFEFPAFAGGTNQIAKAIAFSGAISVAGGGDTAAAIEKSGYADKFTFISTGGGAFLEFLAGNPLPGIEILK